MVRDDAGTAGSGPALCTTEGDAPIVAHADEVGFELVFAASPQPMWVFDRQTLAFLAVNDAAVARYGYSRDEFLAMRISDIRPAEDVPRLQEDVRAPRGARKVSGEWRHRLRDGRIIDVSIISHALRFAGREAALITAEDIAERKRAEEALRASEERYRRIVETAQEGIWQIDSDFNTVFVNRKMADLLGYTPDEMLGRSLLQFTLDDLHTKTRVSLDRQRADIAGQHETLLPHKNGTMVPVLMSTNALFDADGRYTGALAMVTDITDRVRVESELRHLALHDPLTGLPNRALLQDRLGRELHAARSSHTASPLALLLLDLDRFKEVNDAFGHHHGDLLLQQVAARLQRALRASDTLARLGGDEFAVLLPGEDEAAAVTTAGRIDAALDTPFVVEGHVLHVGCSIGIALCPAHGRDAETLLRRADVAMYVAKRAGGSYALYRPEQDEHTPDRLALIADLRRAIDAGELLLHYQPKADLLTRRPRGVEALVRWPHARHGLLGPGQFIPLAEQAGLMAPLTYWVLKEALGQCQAWHRAGLDLEIAVNLCAGMLHDPSLPGEIARLLQCHDLPPSCLRVEVTESTLMADVARSREVLAGLAGLGVGVSVDDYGTGYSSLAYLKRLPVDELKIDMSFVQQVVADESDAAIVASTINLGHSLGLRVVAEGVEDAATWTWLAEMGCDMAQGYDLSRPLPAATLEQWLRQAP